MRDIGRRGVLAGVTGLAVTLAGCQSDPPDRRPELVEQYHRAQENVVASNRNLEDGKRLLDGEEPELAGPAFTMARTQATDAGDRFARASAMAAGLGYESVVRDAEAGQAVARTLGSCSDAWFEYSERGGREPTCEDVNWAGLADVTEVRSAVGL
ncbi:hypothetical protein [Haloarchaeobius sp. TZWSO28]|uniref:hypothetical protein n=1 Tax=Haloarchaeobius sp. TZWSO28 TaxID=3446119 RepID=UPI003EBD00B1